MVALAVPVLAAAAGRLVVLVVAVPLLPLSFQLPSGRPSRPSGPAGWFVLTRLPVPLSDLSRVDRTPSRVPVIRLYTTWVTQCGLGSNGPLVVLGFVFRRSFLSA